MEGQPPAFQQVLNIVFAGGGGVSLCGREARAGGARCNNMPERIYKIIHDGFIS